MKCYKCGYENQDNATFCNSCGANIDFTPNSPRYYEPYNQTYASPPSPEIADAESKSTASLAMGIIGIVLGFFLVGLVLGPIAMTKGKQARTVLNERNNSFWIALAGIITGTIGLVISSIAALYWIILIPVSMRLFF